MYSGEGLASGDRAFMLARAARKLSKARREQGPG
jgi:hypothetical protein